MSEKFDANSDDYDFLIKLLALGNSSVGKTCLLQRYIDNAYSSDFGNTVGVDFKQKKILYKPKKSTGVVEKETKLNLQLWDTAGQERFKSLTVSFFRDAMGFLLVFDLCDEKSFTDLREWVQLLKTNSYCENPDIVLVGNKKDLASRRAVSHSTASEFAKEMKIPYIETSASKGENVNEAFMLLVDLVMERINNAVDKNFLPAKKKTKTPVAPKKENNSCLC